MLDASSAGEGSAGRNSGFLINLPHNTRMSGHHSPLQIARKQIAMYQAGLDWLAQLSQQGGFDCGWDLAGSTTPPPPRGSRNLRASLAQYRDWGVAYTELDRDAMREQLGTDYYQFGYHSMNNVFAARRADSRTGRHAAGQRLADGEQSGRIGGWRRSHRAHAQWPVQRRQRDPGQQCLRAAAGFLRSRLVTIYTYAGVTPVLDAAQALLGQRDQWGVIPANRLGTTLRRIRGGRFMVRSAYSYEAEQPLERMAGQLRASFQRRYPQLAAHDFEYV